MEMQQKFTETEIIAGLSARLLATRRGWLKAAARSPSPQIFKKLAGMFAVQNAIRADVLQALKDQSRLHGAPFAAELCALLRAEYERLTGEASARRGPFLLESLWFCIDSPAGDFRPFVAFARGVAAGSDLPAGLNEEIGATCDLFEGLRGDNAAAARALEAWRQGRLAGGDRLIEAGLRRGDRQMLEELLHLLREQPDRADFEPLAARYLAGCEALGQLPDAAVAARMAVLGAEAQGEAEAIIADLFAPPAARKGKRKEEKKDG